MRYTIRDCFCILFHLLSNETHISTLGCEGLFIQKAKTEKQPVITVNVAVFLHRPPGSHFLGHLFEGDRKV